jgi:hypothetical protein
MAKNNCDLPPYSALNSSNKINAVQPTAPQVCPQSYYIVDEMIPFSIILSDLTEKEINTFEIRSGSELINVLNSLELSNSSWSIKFTHSTNNSMIYRYVGDIFRWIPTKYIKKSPNPIYNIIKTFLTFKYEPLPVVKCDYSILIGYVISDVQYIFWKTNLSLQDSINLVKKLVPYNDNFYVPKKNTNNPLCYYIGLSAIGYKYICTEDCRCITAEKALEILENTKKLNPLHATFL